MSEYGSIDSETVWTNILFELPAGPILQNGLASPKATFATGATATYAIGCGTHRHESAAALAGSGAKTTARSGARLGAAASGQGNADAGMWVCPEAAVLPMPSRQLCASPPRALLPNTRPTAPPGSCSRATGAAGLPSTLPPPATTAPASTATTTPLPETVEVLLNGMTKDEDGRVRPSIAFGVFYTQRYRQDQPCVLYQGTFLSRSEFEKRGGAAGNRWHTSIKVASDGSTLGSWLEQRGLPVQRAAARKARKRPGAGAALLPALPAPALGSSTPLQCHSQWQQRAENQQQQQQQLYSASSTQLHAVPSAAGASHGADNIHKRHRQQCTSYATETISAPQPSVADSSMKLGSSSGPLPSPLVPRGATPPPPSAAPGAAHGAPRPWGGQELQYAGIPFAGAPPQPTAKEVPEHHQDLRWNAQPRAAAIHTPSDTWSSAGGTSGSRPGPGYAVALAASSAACPTAATAAPPAFGSRPSIALHRAYSSHDGQPQHHTHVPQYVACSHRHHHQQHSGQLPVSARPLPPALHGQVLGSVWPDAAAAPTPAPASGFAEPTQHHGVPTVPTPAPCPTPFADGASAAAAAAAAAAPPPAADAAYTCFMDWSTTAGFVRGASCPCSVQEHKASHVLAAGSGGGSSWAQGAMAQQGCGATRMQQQEHQQEQYACVAQESSQWSSSMSVNRLLRQDSQVLAFAYQLAAWDDRQQVTAPPAFTATGYSSTATTTTSSSAWLSDKN